MLPAVRHFYSGVDTKGTGTHLNYSGIGGPVSLHATSHPVVEKLLEPRSVAFGLLEAFTLTDRHAI
jgi:hypothetical protein